MTRGRECAEIDLQKLEKVRAIFVSFSRYLNAKTIYTSNNPNVTNFANAFEQTFRLFFEDEKELQLTVEQYRIKWRDEVVYGNDQKTDSIAFLLYKDGIGEITFQSSVKRAELEQFVDLIKNEIYSQTAQDDLVDKMWQADFTNIFFRVLDEYTEGASGDGNGTGTGSREQPLRVNDHPDIPGADDADTCGAVASHESIDSLGTYIYNLVEKDHPHAPEHLKEERFQDMLDSLFSLGHDGCRSWQDDVSLTKETDKLFWLFNVMIDFTQKHYTPSIVRDILDIIERLVRYIKEEANISTLIAILDIQKRMAMSPDIAADFETLPARIEDELTNSVFLSSLGNRADRSNNDVSEILRYYRLVGKDAVPGICGLLCNLKDPLMHKEACDVLIEIAEDDIEPIVNGLDGHNPLLARDVVYLLGHCSTNEIPPVIKKLLSSPNVQVREQVIKYLVHVGTEEAALLLCNFLDDADKGIRMKTLAAVEEFKNPLIVEKVTSICFAEDFGTKSMEELEHMFRAVGKLAGERVITYIEKMTRKKGWFLFRGNANKRDKLLAITAMRYIPGGQSMSMLKKLAGDADGRVRAKAQYALKLLEESDDASGDETLPAQVEWSENDK